MPVTTFADGVYQFGGMPVGNSFLVSKIFSTPIKGRAWFVDTSYGGSGTGKSPKTAFNTMAQAFSVLQSGDVIYFVGKVKEQLITPVNVFDVTVVGCGNRTRHADSTPVGGSNATATWAAPAAPAAATALVQVLQQGWRFVNILFAGLVNSPCIQFSRDSGVGDLERDASHAEVLSCRFAGAAGAGIGIQMDTGQVFDIHVKDCNFQDLATAISGGPAFRCIIEDNYFQGNTNAIACNLTESVVKGNMMGSFTTKSIELDGTNTDGLNIVTLNYLTGTYSISGGYKVANANDEWGGNMNSTSGGWTAADPA